MRPFVALLCAMCAVAASAASAGPHTPASSVDSAAPHPLRKAQSLQSRWVRVTDALRGRLPGHLRHSQWVSRHLLHGVEASHSRKLSAAHVVEGQLDFLMEVSVCRPSVPPSRPPCWSPLSARALSACVCAVCWLWVRCVPHSGGRRCVWWWHSCLCSSPLRVVRREGYTLTLPALPALWLWLWLCVVRTTLTSGSTFVWAS